MALVVDAVEFVLLEQFLDSKQEILRYYLDPILFLEQCQGKELNPDHYQ